VGDGRANAVRVSSLRARSEREDGVNSSTGKGGWRSKWKNFNWTGTQTRRWSKGAKEKRRERVFEPGLGAIKPMNHPSEENSTLDLGQFTGSDRY